MVAEHDGEIVGQVMITYEWSDWRNGNIWWLQSVYVRPDWRGKGVFRQLFEFVRHEAAHSTEVCGVRLYMHGSNERARKVYTELGFAATEYQVFELSTRSSTFHA
jgi:GNAT superfamily N-acetyltransferase